MPAKSTLPSTSAERSASTGASRDATLQGWVDYFRQPALNEIGASPDTLRAHQYLLDEQRRRARIVRFDT